MIGQDRYLMFVNILFQTAFSIAYTTVRDASITDQMNKDRSDVDDLKTDVTSLKSSVSSLESSPSTATICAKVKMLIKIVFSHVLRMQKSMRYYSFLVETHLVVTFVL